MLRHNLRKTVMTAGLTFVLAGCVLPAQAGIRWLSTEYDFGAFPEAGGKRSGEVKFVNEGPEPTMINRVRLTCGCTSETHTEGIINPGDTAFVNFTYNPAGRPGRFEKSIKVYTGTDNDLTTVRMRGTVIGAPQTLATDYPVEAGALRLDARKVDFGKVRHGSSRHHFVTLYNQSAEPIRPVWSQPAAALDVAISSETIPPGDLATLSIYLNTRDEEEMGPVEYAFDIMPDASSPENVATYTVSAVIEPDTQNMSADDLARAPRVECAPRLLDVGIINPASMRNASAYPLTFTLSNAGQTELHVARIYANGVPLKVKRYPAILKGGKNGKVEATVDFRKFPAGPFSFKIEIVSDDPLHPLTSVGVSGEISTK